MINASEITTYQAGTLQAQANRSLNALKTEVLKKYGLTSMHWVVLGNIYDGGKKGVRTSDLAKSLATTQAYVTNSVKLLEAKDFVGRLSSTTDSRSRKIVFNFKRKKLFLKIESDTRRELREKVYAKITRKELDTYLNVIMKFSG